MSEFRTGLKDGVAIGLGYLSVSFAFGVSAAKGGLPLWATVAISMTNLTSAGQLAGLSVILASGGWIEMILTQFVINLRYALMSVTLSQKIPEKTSLPRRMLMAFGITDEIFAVSAAKRAPVTPAYYFGLMTLPYWCWAGGTFLGAAAGGILPARVLSALGVAIYAMFIAIVLPAAKKSRPVLIVAAIALLFRCAFVFLPFLKTVGSGFAVIFCAVAAAAVGAWIYPAEDAA